MASENDWKCERIFQMRNDGLINFSRISHPSRAAARCTIEPLPLHPPLPPGGFSGGNSFGMQSGQNASFGLLPGGDGFWISVVLVQARFDYRFFLFAKFPVIEPRFTIEFIQLGPNSRRSSALSLGSASRISDASVWARNGTLSCSTLLDPDRTRV
jgi:hypothetical protein